MPLIELDDLTIRYPGRKHPTLEHVSLDFSQGETVLLLGASGSGKSTLALALNGLIPHSLGAITTGRVVVDGFDTQTHSVAEIARRVGIVFQDPEAQFVTLKVEDEIVFGLENLRVPREQMQTLVSAALANVGMLPFNQRCVDQLSGGQKQRVALAALLAMEPQVLIFDEPTANLDPIGTQDVFALIAAHKARHTHTIVLIEHKLDELMHLIDRVVVLGERGAIIANGSPRAVFRDYAAALHHHGVWMPQICLLAHRLRERGVLLDPFPVTLEEAVMGLGGESGRKGKEGHLFHPLPRLPLSPSRFLAVEVRNLSFRYGANNVLDHVSFAVPQGDFLAIVGANGAGKTTLAQHIMGILQPPRETVFVDGQDVSRAAARTLVQRIGYVFQNPEHQFIADSVFEEVAYGLRILGLTEFELEAKANALLERFGLLRYGKANPFTLSHGEKRRLSVATMLAMGQQTLILDEPTFGQDQRNAEAMMALLRELHAEGHTIIIITHDMALVAEHAKHVVVMAGGQLLFHGATRSCFAQPELLVQARLTPPPLGRLGWPGVLTLDDAMNAIHQELKASNFHS